MSLSRRGRVLSFFFSSRRRHTRFDCDWSSDVCSSDLVAQRYPSGHALHIVRWMQVITFDEPDVERASELRSEDRKSVVKGKSVDLGGRRIIKKKKKKNILRNSPLK